MKWLWRTVLLLEVVLVIAFCLWASTADYFVRMPASVQRGSTVFQQIAIRAVWLLIALGTLNASLALSLRGVHHVEESRRAAGFLAFVAAIALFLVACWLLLMFVIVGFAQY